MLDGQDTKLSLLTIVVQDLIFGRHRIINDLRASVVENLPRVNVHFICRVLDMSDVMNTLYLPYSVAI